MAIQERFSVVGAFNKTSGSTIGRQIGSGNNTVWAEPQAGDLIWVAVACDNLSGTTPTISSVSKPAGETGTWVVEQEAGSTTTSAAGGVRVIIAAIEVLGGGTWDGHTVTITLSGTVTAKAMHIGCIKSSIGGVVSATGWGSSASASSPATGYSYPSTGYAAMIVAYGQESATAPGFTGGFYNYASTAATATSGGGAASNIGITAGVATIGGSFNISSVSSDGEWAFAVATVTETNPNTPISGSESTAITISDSSSLSISYVPAGSESTAISVAETTAILKTMTASDTGAVSIAETTSLTGKTVTDTAAVSVTDTSQVSAIINASDGAAVSVAESRTQAATFSTTDTGAITIAESTSISGQASAPVGSESTAISVAETSVVIVTSTVLEVVNGTFENGTAGWSSDVGTVVGRSTSPVHSGTYSLSLYRPDAGANDVNHARGNFFPVTAGGYYTVEAWVSGSGNAFAGIDWYDSGKNLLSGNNFQDYSGGSLVLRGGTWKAPTSAVYGRVHTGGVGMAVGQTSYVDDVVVYETVYVGSTVSDNFSGPDVTSIDGRTTTTGGKTWVNPDGRMGTTAGQMYQSSGTNAQAFVDTGIADGTYEWQFTTGASLSDYNGFYVRRGSPTAIDYLKIEQDGSKWVLKKFIINGDTQLA
jgi:hypothetical protein